MMHVAPAKDNTINNQLWIDYYPSFYINEKLQFAGDTGYRTILNDQSWRKVYLCPTLRYYRNKTIEFNGGLGLFYEFNKSSGDRFEI